MWTAWCCLRPDVFCIHLMIKHKGYNVIEATDVILLWCLGGGREGFWGAAAPSGYVRGNYTVGLWKHGWIFFYVFPHLKNKNRVHWKWCGAWFSSSGVKSLKIQEKGQKAMVRYVRVLILNTLLVSGAMGTFWAQPSCLENSQSGRKQTEYFPVPELNLIKHPGSFLQMSNW